MSNNASITSQVTSQIAVTGTSTKNNRGVIRRAGNLNNTVRWTAQTIGEPLKNFSQRVFQTTQVGAALSGGTFYYRAGHLIRRVTSTINGTSNTKLLSGGSDFGRMRAVNRAEGTRFSFLSGWSWSVGADGNVVYTATVGAGAQFGGLWKISANADATAGSDDDVANPTRLIPGELVYKAMKNAPVTADYTAKNA